MRGPPWRPRQRHEQRSRRPEDRRDRRARRRRARQSRRRGGDAAARPGEAGRGRADHDASGDDRDDRDDARPGDDDARARPATPAPQPAAPPAPQPAAPPAPQPAAPAAPQPAAPPAPGAAVGPGPGIPFTPPVNGPLDFLNSPVSKLELAPEPPQERPRPPRPRTTPGRQAGERRAPDGAPADGAVGAEDGLGNPLDPATRPAEIPSFFIGRFAIPPFLLPIYQAAGIEYGIPWEVLAAINDVETDYGRNLGVSSAGALGWMQFMPASWTAYGVDANEDGRKDPMNPVDAIFAAARYLRAAGAASDLRRAIFAYNHAGWYVRAVLSRAQLIAGMPSDLVGSLTGLAQGRLPVAGALSYGRRAPGAGPRRGLRILAPAGTPVVAVQDGEIVRVGRSPRLGRYVMLRDAYANTYTYGHLATVRRSVLVPKERAGPAPAVAEPLATPLADPAPSQPASAGSNRALATPPGRAPEAEAATAATAAKERLFANPARPRSLRSGGRRQILDATFALPAAADLRSYFAGEVGLERGELELRRLYPGRRVIAGAILGRIGTTRVRGAPHVLFEIRPPGADVPRVDPEPFLEGWRLLETTAIHRARGAGRGAASVGQILLMSKDVLARRVLADPRIEIYPCGRRDVAAGLVDRRVLAVLAVLAASELRPTVSSLRCGHASHAGNGSVSQHASGNAVDIVKVNGIPINGNQGQDTIADATVRRLLTLQGTMAPDQIISLMSYPGVPNTLAMTDHADHIHVGFRPRPGGATADGVHALGLRPAQWLALVDRIGRIENPAVAQRPSRYALRAAPVRPSLGPPRRARELPAG